MPRHPSRAIPRPPVVLPPPALSAGPVPPTPLREEADPRYRGRGITLAVVDSGFFPHPDLIQPRDRIKAYHDASGEDFPLYSKVESWQWHGTMTTCVAAGSGYLSAERFRGIASEADLVLVKAGADGHIPSEAVERGLRWVLENRERYGIRIVNVSLGVEDPSGAVDEAADALVKAGVVVVAAAGNDLSLPESPGCASCAITVGGYEVESFGAERRVSLYSSSYGLADGGVLKPEVIAPAVRVAFPILPGTHEQKVAQALIEVKEAPDSKLPDLFKYHTRRFELPEGIHRHPPEELRAAVNAMLARSNVVDRNYQSADGTSVAAPIVSSVVAQMLEANPALTPAQVKTLLVSSAIRVAHAPVERQGFGMLNARGALDLATQDKLPSGKGFAPPRVSRGKLTFYLFDPEAQSAALAGDFNGWSQDKNPMRLVSTALWRVDVPCPASGTYRYKFVVDGSRWVEDPANMRRVPDGYDGTNAVVEVR